MLVQVVISTDQRCELSDLSLMAVNRVS